MNGYRVCVIQEINFYGVGSICSQGGGVHMVGVRGIDMADHPFLAKLMLKVTCRNYYLRTHLGDNKYLLPWDA